MITVKVNTSFSDVKQDWDNLIHNNSSTTVYQSKEYAEMLYNHRLPYSIILQIRPVFYSFFEDDRCVLILPLYRRLLHHDHVLFGYKTGCGYLDAICDDTMTVDKMEICFNMLSKMKVGTIRFSYVQEKSVLAEYLLRKGGTYSETTCAAIELPDEYADYNKGLSKNTRQNLRTAYNRMETDGVAWEIKHFRGKELPESCRLDLLELYTRRQIQRYNKVGWLFVQFVHHIDLGTVAQRSGLEDTFVLYINKKIAAYFDALRFNDSFVVPRLAIEEEYARYSPGMILLDQSIQWLLTNCEIKRIDLTHGNEAYKLRMGAKEHKCVQCVLSFN